MSLAFCFLRLYNKGAGLSLPKVPPRSASAGLHCEGSQGQTEAKGHLIEVNRGKRQRYAGERQQLISTIVLRKAFPREFQLGCFHPSPAPQRRATERRAAAPRSPLPTLLEANPNSSEAKDGLPHLPITRHLGKRTSPRSLGGEDPSTLPPTPAPFSNSRNLPSALFGF